MLDIKNPSNTYYAIIYSKYHEEKGMNHDGTQKVQALCKVDCTSFLGKYNLSIGVANHQPVNCFQIAETPALRWEFALHRKLC